MNVRLPDGTVIKGVPEGTTKAELIERLQRNGYDVSGLAVQSQPQGTGSKAGDAGNAVGTGFWRGAARLAGLPVDTVQNVIDLGKAGAGTLYREVTGSYVPQALEVNSDRSNVVGSGDWLLKQARRSEGGRLMVDPANPEYEGGYLQNTGSALAGGVVGPQSVPQLANQVLLSATAANAGKAAYELTGDPALAVTASLLPAGAQTATGQVVRRAVRGGEAGRRQMEQRVADLKAAGIDEPTLGLASGNQLVGGAENLLQSTPGAVGRMQRARDQAVIGAQTKAAQAADMASATRGSLEAGQAIQRGVRAFRDDFKAKQGALYDQLDSHIDRQTPVDVSNTKRTLSTLNADIPGAPELSKQFRNARISAIESAIAKDTAGAPETVMVYKQPAKGGGGVMNLPVEQPPILVKVPAGPSRNTLPFEAVKKTRTLVGSELADTNLASTVPRSKWNPLYGALADDLAGAATKAGPQAERVYGRANRFSRAGMDRLDRVQPFVNPDAPEQSFNLANRALGDNTSTFRALKKTLPQGARGTVAATVIDRLGRATPGQQNASGDAWSPETFLTNWNRMGSQGRKELFSGFSNATQVQRDVTAVAKATSMMRDTSKMWANPSGTGANLAARATLGALPFSAFVDPLAPLAIGGGLLMSRGLAEVVTNPASVNFFTQRSGLPPATQLGLLNTVSTLPQRMEQKRK